MRFGVVFLIFISYLSAGAQSLSDMIGNANKATQTAGTQSSPTCTTSSGPTDTEKDWAKAGYNNPQIQDITMQYAPDQKFTHKFELDAIVVRGAGWSKVDVERQYAAVGKIYAQCNVKLEKVRLVEVDAPLKDIPPPAGILDFKPNIIRRNGERVGSTAEFCESMPSKNRLTMIHVRSLSGGLIGVASQESEVGIRDKCLNKQWISAAVLEPQFKLIYPKDYSLEAHELGHVLLNCGHTDHANLMAGDIEKKNGHLTKEQCDRVKSHAMVHSI